MCDQARVRGSFEPSMAALKWATASSGWRCKKIDASEDVVGLGVIAPGIG